MSSIFSSQPADRILEKVLDGNRISPEEALTLYREGDYLKIMATARTLREKILPHTYASYTMFRVVNYTNYCNVECSFCSFMDEIGNGKGYVLSKEQILEKMDYAVGEGADQMFLQGGVYPDLSFDYYLDVIASVKKNIRTCTFAHFLRLKSSTWKR
ncbi:radical SAM domain protein [Leptospira santarosai str. CBC1416]|uniref:Radical SAM domain protein n=1 Tax=Leptospira santarosai str. CBC1416 TaxID=1193059 RepID=M6VVA7_9LEPT|nr:radical SAM domain protein [Leptospira santarosai str. CBC1416]